MRYRGLKQNIIEPSHFIQLSQVTFYISMSAAIRNLAARTGRGVERFFQILFGHLFIALCQLKVPIKIVRIDACRIDSQRFPEHRLRFFIIAKTNWPARNLVIECAQAGIGGPL